MNFFRWVRYLFALGAVIVTLIQLNMGKAYAAIQKPSLLSGNADLSQMDQAATSTVDFVLGVAAAMGVVALAISLALCTPFVGHKDKGIPGIKGSIAVLVGIGFIYMLYGFLGTLIK